MTPRARRVSSLSSALLLAAGCYDQKGDTGGYEAPSGGLWDVWASEDEDDDGYADEGWTDEPYEYSEDGAGYTPEGGENPYFLYEGWQSIEYDDGAQLCQLVWSAAGERVLHIPPSCPNCEFAFEVTLAYEEGSSSAGPCADQAQDFRYVYAYSPDYYGYSLLLVGDGGGWYYPRAYAEFDGAKFTYYLDFPLYGSYSYEEYFLYGTAEIR